MGAEKDYRFANPQEEISCEHLSVRQTGPDLDALVDKGVSTTLLDSPLTVVSDRDHGVFGNEKDAPIRYQTLSWPMVTVLMIAETVSNGMLSLPSAISAVGVVPGVIIIIFLGSTNVSPYCTVF